MTVLCIEAIAPLLFKIICYVPFMLMPKGQEKLAEALPLWEQAQLEAIAKLGIGSWHNLLERLTEIVA